jgi:flagellar basal-body rod modification protein FlgD
MAISQVESTSLYSELGLGKKQDDKKTGDDELGKDAFLELMITQMKNQNPLEPQGNAEFVAQLAQFSSLEGITNLNETVTKLAGGFQSSQALQASSLVGRTVKIETDKAYLPEGGHVYGTVDLPYSTSGVRINVYNDKKELVFQEDLGAQEAGEVVFAWDGKLEDGTTLAAGRYTFEAIATHDGKPQQVGTYLGANVNSVTIGTDQQVTLNIAGAGPVALTEVKEIL